MIQMDPSFSLDLIVKVVTVAEAAPAAQFMLQNSDYKFPWIR